MPAIAPTPPPATSFPIPVPIGNTKSFGRLDRRLRSIRRLALLFVAIATTTLLPTEARAIWPFDRFAKQPPLEERAATLLSKAIQIRTVNPPGGEADLARLFADELDRVGIENQVVTTPSPDGGPERAAVWARLRGRGNRPGIALLSHLDTVPANPREWSVDPFSGRIWNGFVWGRGALDAKGVAVTHLLTLIEIAAADQPLDRDIVFLATPEEETGGAIGAGWIAKTHPELLAGVGYLLTEGGGIQASSEINGGSPEVWGVTLTEKAPCWLELRAHGRAGHSSAPTPDAAVPRLIAALDRIRRVESPIHVLDEVARMFSSLAPMAPDWDKAGFQDLRNALENDVTFARRFVGNPGQNAMVRNTVSITVLEGAPKTNVAPAMARAQLDARLLPGELCSDYAESIGELIDEPAIDIVEILSFPARASTSDTPLYRAIEAVADLRESGAVVVPRMIGGFTDAHWFRELGIVSYGFVPRALAREEGRRVHGIDERIRVETLVGGIRLTTEILRKFDELDR